MQELHARWEEIWEGILAGTFHLDTFKSVFLDTWRYFVDATSTGRFKITDLHLIIIMARILGYDHYPKTVHLWEYDAVRQFIEGLVNTVANGVCPAGINEGFIVLEVYCHCTFSAHIDEFDKCFAIACDDFGERYDFDDGLDID